MKPNATTVVLADDNNLYREGLSGLFDRWEEFKVVGEAENGLEAVTLCRRHSPDIVLMDVQMPVMDGIEAVCKILEEQPDVAIVMLTVSDNDRYLFEALRAGARGFVLKSVRSHQLRDLLHGVVEGGSVLSSEVTPYLIEAVKRVDGGGVSEEKVQAKLARLSIVEKDVLCLLAMGESNRDIGLKLLMSESSVKKKISSLLMKLGLENRVQAAVFAISAGLYDPRAAK